MILEVAHRTSKPPQSARLNQVLWLTHLEWRRVAPAHLNHVPVERPAVDSATEKYCLRGKTRSANSDWAVSQTVECRVKVHLTSICLEIGGLTAAKANQSRLN